MKKILLIVLIMLNIFVAFGCSGSEKANDPVFSEYITSTNNATDRTDEILSVLSSKKICHLGPGDFVVRGIDLPEGAMLAGSGYATKLILKDTAINGYVVKIHSYGSIKDINIIGSVSDIGLSEITGDRHGILFEGMADSKGKVPYKSMVSNCWIRNFTGGGITFRNTGYSTKSTLLVSNCYISKCHAGINIPFWSEYNLINNVSATECYYGCINNGGNNMFSNCNFSSNQVGILMDNTSGKNRNNSHGSFTGCLVNHSGGNKGTAIKISGMHSGEIFQGCQIFYGKVVIDNARGIRFANINFGKNTPIEVSNSTTVQFTDCTMLSASHTPVKMRNSINVLFTGCYYRGSGNKFDSLQQ